MVESDPTSNDDYYDQTTVKKKLKIPQGSTKFDEDLDDAGEEANRATEDILFSESGKVRLNESLSPQEKESADKFATYDTCWRYKITQRASKDEVANWKSLRDEAMKNLISKLQAQPEENTQHAFVTVVSEYRTDVVD